MHRLLWTATILTWLCRRYQCALQNTKVTKLNPCEFQEHANIIRALPIWKDEHTALMFQYKPTNNYSDRVCYWFTEEKADGMTDEYADYMCHLASAQLASFDQNLDDLKEINEYLNIQDTDHKKIQSRWIISPYYHKDIETVGFKYKQASAMINHTSLGGVEWGHRSYARERERIAKGYNINLGAEWRYTNPMCVEVTNIEKSGETKAKLYVQACKLRWLQRGALCEWRMAFAKYPGTKWGSWSKHPSTGCTSFHREYHRRRCGLDLENIEISENDQDPCVNGAVQYEWITTNCIYRPSITWAPWTSWSDTCIRKVQSGELGVRTRFSDCVQTNPASSNVEPESCDEYPTREEETSCDCKQEYWTRWSACTAGKKSKSRCGNWLRDLPCKTDVQPSRTEWEEWGECFDSSRKRKRTCYVDKRNYTNKHWYNFIKCATQYEYEANKCDDKCRWLEFTGQIYTYDICYTVMGGFFATTAFIWCLCLTCGCGKKKGLEQLSKNLARLQKIKKANSKGKSKRGGGSKKSKSKR